MTSALHTNKSNFYNTLTLNYSDIQSFDPNSVKVDELIQKIQTIYIEKTTDNFKENEILKTKISNYGLIGKTLTVISGSVLSIIALAIAILNPYSISFMLTYFPSLGTFLANLGIWNLIAASSMLIAIFAIVAAILILSLIIGLYLWKIMPNFQSSDPQDLGPINKEYAIMIKILNILKNIQKIDSTYQITQEDFDEIQSIKRFTLLEKTATKEEWDQSIELINPLNSLVKYLFAKKFNCSNTNLDSQTDFLIIVTEQLDRSLGSIKKMKSNFKINFK